MNLYGLTRGAISKVNPLKEFSVRVSTGSTVDAAGVRTPTYAEDIVVLGQHQPLQFRDIQQLDGLNIAGNRSRIYLSEQVNGLVRVKNVGGDLITDVANGDVWLVVVIAETWPDWCAALVQLQDGS